MTYNTHCVSKGIQNKKIGFTTLIPSNSSLVILVHTSFKGEGFRSLFACLKYTIRAIHEK